MHWADVLAGHAATRDPPIVLATAITPSGPIHVGNMREVLTTEMVYRSLRDVEKAECELVYIADSYDPLRKVYPFLNPAAYEPHVGKPLREIPCPCGDHDHYAAHFLEPFFAALSELGVEMRVLDAYDLYHEGRYRDTIEEAMGARERVREIVEQVSKRKLPHDWIPFNIQCAACRRVTSTRPTAVHELDVLYHCQCGHQDRADVTHPGTGKLPWRVDWPARWKFLNVGFEAMGKDHAAAGGSWDTGVRLVEEVFGHRPPVRTVYEFVQIKGGKGAVHSSILKGEMGTGVSATELLNMTPPEALRFLFARTHPSKHIDFDPGLGILQLVDDFDEWERTHHGAQAARAGMNDVERTYRLSMPNRVPDRIPLQVPYRHLVTVTQTVDAFDDVLTVLRRTGDAPETLDDVDRGRLAARVDHVRYWVERFAPEEVRFRLHEDVPDVEFRADELDILRAAVDALRTLEWRPEAIHNALHEAAKAHGHRPGVAFGAVYKAFLGRERGPRAGYFLAQLGKPRVLARFEAVLGRARAPPTG